MTVVVMTVLVAVAGEPPSLASNPEAKPNATAQSERDATFGDRYPLRTWRAWKGSATLEARLVEVTADAKVRLKTADGTIRETVVKHLSDADLDYLQGLGPSCLGLNPLVSIVSSSGRFVLLGGCEYGPSAVGKAFDLRRGPTYLDVRGKTLRVWNHPIVVGRIRIVSTSDDRALAQIIESRDGIRKMDYVDLPFPEDKHSLDGETGCKQ